MRRLGIAVGGRVRVTRRVTIELKARSDAAVAPGQVFIPFCFAKAAAKVLTNPQLDPFGKISEYKFCAAGSNVLQGRRRPNRSLSGTCMPYALACGTTMRASASVT